MNPLIGVIDKLLGMISPLFKPSAILARQRKKTIYRADKFFRLYTQWLNAPSANHKQVMTLEAKMLIYFHSYKRERDKLA